MAKIAAVIPVFNSQATLNELYERLVAALTPISDDFEIVLIEDAGADGSWELIAALAAKDARVKAMRFSRNFGQHHAITAGLDVCDADWVVLMDCDLQDDPAEIAKLYARACEGFDVVLARRSQRRDTRWKRSLSWGFYRAFGWLTGIPWDERIGMFRILSRTVVEQLRTMREQLRFIVGLVDWMGFPTSTVDVRHSARPSGRSQYTLRRLFRLAFAAVIAHSDRPLRLAIGLGFGFSVGAFLLGLLIVFRYFMLGNPIIGWSSLFVTVCFIGGIIISLIGVLGVYLGKVFDQVKGRPLYIVRNRLNL